MTPVPQGQWRPLRVARDSSPPGSDEGESALLLPMWAGSQDAWRRVRTFTIARETPGHTQCH